LWSNGIWGAEGAAIGAGVFGRGKKLGEMLEFYRNAEKERLKILSIRQCNAEKAGVDRKTFQRIKTRIQKSKKINIKTGAVTRLLAMR